MLRRALLISGVLLSGSLGFASVAGAQAVNTTVNYTGTVPASCAFVLPAGATAYPTVTMTNTNNTSLSGTANLSVDCNAAATLSAGTPSPVGATPTATATPTVTGGTLAAGSNSPTVQLNVTPSSGTILPAGTYNYGVTVTATPQ